MPSVHTSSRSGAAGAEEKIAIEAFEKVDLNCIFQEAIKKHNGARQNLSLVVRCESLPEVLGFQPFLSQIFDELISVITGYVSRFSQLFLHIDCDVVPATKSADRYYLIRFNANIQDKETWAETHAHTLFACERLLIAQGGKLTINKNGAAGCLFSIMLPDKFG